MAQFPYEAFMLGRAGKPRKVTVIAHAEESEGWMYPVAQTFDGEYLRLTNIYPDKRSALQKAISNLEESEARHVREARSLARRRKDIEQQLSDCDA